MNSFFAFASGFGLPAVAFLVSHTDKLEDLLIIVWICSFCFFCFALFYCIILHLHTLLFFKLQTFSSSINKWCNRKHISASSHSRKNKALQSFGYLLEEYRLNKSWAKGSSGKILSHIKGGFLYSENFDVHRALKNIFEQATYFNWLEENVALQDVNVFLAKNCLWEVINKGSYCWPNSKVNA